MDKRSTPTTAGLTPASTGPPATGQAGGLASPAGDDRVRRALHAARVELIEVLGLEQAQEAIDLLGGDPNVLAGYGPPVLHVTCGWTLNSLDRLVCTGEWLIARHRDSGAVHRVPLQSVESPLSPLVCAGGVHGPATAHRREQATEAIHHFLLSSASLAAKARTVPAENKVDAMASRRSVPDADPRASLEDLVKARNYVIKKSGRRNLTQTAVALRVPCSTRTLQYGLKRAGLSWKEFRDSEQVS